MLRITSRLIFTFGLLFSVLVVIDSYTSLANTTKSNEESDNAGKFALLIGIDKYSNGIKPLNGAVADALAMKRLLTNPKFGFPEDDNHVKVLKDEDATKEGILTTFRTQLIENAKAYKEKTGKEATIFFHYSGHGSQVKLPEGVENKADEPDGLDETIVPVDSSRNGNGEGFDIRDDEIFALVSELSDYTSNVVYVFDSCNSGTVNRGSEVAREVPADTRKQPAYQVRNTKTKDGKDKNYDDFLLGSDKYVFIAGTQSRHKSYEINEGGISRGALSFYLERALRDASPQTTYAELMRRVGSEVNHHNSDQEPQLAGDKRRLILGGNFKDGDIPIPVVDVDTNTKLVTIAAGRMLGLREGSLIAIHDKNDIKIAEGVVTTTKDQTAFVSYTLLGDKVIEKTSTAKLLSPLFGAEPINILLQLDNKSNTLKSKQGGDAVLQKVAEEIKEKTKNVFNVELLEPAQKPKTNNEGINVSTISVKRSGFREAFCGAIETKGLDKVQVEKRCSLRIPEPSLAKDEKTKIPLPKDDEEVFYIAPTGSGEPLFDFYVRLTDENAATKISDALLKYSRQKNLLALDNRGGDVAQKIKIEFIEVEGQFDEDGYFVTDNETPIDLKDSFAISRKPGIFYRLQVTNKSDKNLHITVLGLSNDGAINAMYPQESQQEIKPGGFQRTGLFMTGRPYGSERIKIIATKEFSDYSVLAQGAVSKDVSMRNGTNPLTALMNQALASQRDTRVKTAPKTDEWGVAEVSIEIVPE